MPKPFPWPLNIGTDICSIPRILGVLRTENAGSFVRRILTSEEREHYGGRIDQPLRKWQETATKTAKLKEQIDWKRKQLGLSHAEIEYCVALKKAGTKGAPSAWIEELRVKVSAKNERDIADSATASACLASEKTADSNESHTGVGQLWSQRSSFVPLLFQEEKRLNSESSQPISDNVVGKRKVDDVEIIIHLLMKNEEAVKVADSNLQKAAEFMAGRFAAKEAAMKAHHGRRLTYHSVSILPPPIRNRPDLGSRPPIAVILPENGSWEDAQEVRISISHDGDYATAVCLACEPESDTEPTFLITRCPSRYPEDDGMRPGIEPLQWTEGQELSSRFPSACSSAYRKLNNQSCNNSKNSKASQNSLGRQPMEYSALGKSLRAAAVKVMIPPTIERLSKEDTVSIDLLTNPSFGVKAHYTHSPVSNDRLARNSSTRTTIKNEHSAVKNIFESISAKQNSTKLDATFFTSSKIPKDIHCPYCSALQKPSEITSNIVNVTQSQDADMASVDSSKTLKAKCWRCKRLQKIPVTAV